VSQDGHDRRSYARLTRRATTPDQEWLAGRDALGSD
jgi:hypothetical protein